MELSGLEQGLKPSVSYLSYLARLQAAPGKPCLDHLARGMQPAPRRMPHSAGPTMPGEKRCSLGTGPRTQDQEPLA